MKVEANLRSVMRGILFPSSNVFFSAQTTNPANVKQVRDASMATDPLTSVYGQWEAVENSALALSEAANLLLLAGRKCSNGIEVPLKNANWAKFVQGLRDAGMTAYKAAQTKNQDKILDASEVVATACSNCHEEYRDKENAIDRCK